MKFFDKVVAKIAKVKKVDYGKTPTGRPRSRSAGTGGVLTVREKILKALEANPGLMAREISQSTPDTSYSAVSSELRRMYKDGELVRASIDAMGGTAHRYYLPGTMTMTHAPWEPESKPCAAGCERIVYKPQGMDLYHLWLQGHAKCEACACLPAPFLVALAELP